MAGRALFAPKASVTARRPMSRQTTRRRYLSLGATLAVGTLAGCANGGPGEEQGGENQSENEPPEDENASIGSDPENESAGGGNETDGNESAADEAVQNVDYQNPDGSISFVSPEDGAQVSNPVAIEAEVENFELRAAEDDDGEDGVGHLHVIVDHGCVDPQYAIPFEEGYHHLSDAATETELELEPGEHDLCLQAGDGIHNAYALTDEITIEVSEDGEDGGGADNETGGGNESAGNESDGGNESESGNESDE